MNKKGDALTAGVLVVAFVAAVVAQAALTTGIKAPNFNNSAASNPSPQYSGGNLGGPYGR